MSDMQIEEQKQNINKELEDALNEIKTLRFELEDIKKAKQHAFDQYHALKLQADNEKAEIERKQHEELEAGGKTKEILEAYKNKLDEMNNQLQKEREDRNTEKLDALAKDLALKAGVEGKNVRFVARDLKERLILNDGQVGVLDRNGKQSVLSLDDLINEVKSSDDYSDLIVDRKASGSGAAGNTNSGAMAKRFGDLNASEKAELYRKSPEEYNRAKMADRQE